MLKRTLVFLLFVLLVITACGSDESPAANETAGESGEEAAVQPADAQVTVFRAPT